MIKYICDCCNKDIPGNEYQFNHNLYMDSESRPLSVYNDLCLDCYKTIIKPSVDKFLEILKNKEDIPK